MNTKNESKNARLQWWKIGLCVLGVLMIAGAVTYTLVTRATASSSAPTTNTPLPSANVAANKPAVAGTGEMQWVISLNSKWETNDYIFVVFPGNADLNKQMDQAVKTSLEKIRQAGTAAEVVTLSPADPEFQPTLDRLAIQKLPAVLVFGATGQGAIVKGDVTETKLLQAYLTLQKTCAPGAGSSCCPK